MRRLQFSKLTTSKTKQFWETSFKNPKLSAKLTASYQCALQFFHSICLKYCACHENKRPGHAKCCTCQAKSSWQTWRFAVPKCNPSQEISALTSYSIIVNSPRPIQNLAFSRGGLPGKAAPTCDLLAVKQLRKIETMLSRVIASIHTITVDAGLQLGCCRADAGLLLNGCGISPPACKLLLSCCQTARLLLETCCRAGGKLLLKLRDFQGYFLASFGPRFGLVFGLARNPLQKYWVEIQIRTP